MPTPSLRSRSKYVSVKRVGEEQVAAVEADGVRELDVLDHRHGLHRLAGARADDDLQDAALVVLRVEVLVVAVVEVAVRPHLHAHRAAAVRVWVDEAGDEHRPLASADRALHDAAGIEVVDEVGDAEVEVAVGVLRHAVGHVHEVAAEAREEPRTVLLVRAERVHRPRWERHRHETAGQHEAGHNRQPVLRVHFLNLVSSFAFARRAMRQRRR